jgi:hypothetical protein
MKLKNVQKFLLYNKERVPGVDDLLDELELERHQRLVKQARKTEQFIRTIARYAHLEEEVSA